MSVAKGELTTMDLCSARREAVLQAYNSAKAENHLRYLEGDDKATEEYIFENQMEDASNIVEMFYMNDIRVVSIQKKTKVGADGLMIEIAKLLTTHNDDGFVINPANVRIITGMSNAGWEKDMIEKAPNCFKDKIFHHGKLTRAGLTSISNSLIIIDEIDTGDKECQILHQTLKEAGVLDVNHMKENNNRFVFISATMIKELYDLYRWGDLHKLYTMTIPPAYFGHGDFLKKGIAKQFYALMNDVAAKRWVQEDILDNYGNDFRVHIVRVNTKSCNYVQNACISNDIIFRNHTSKDKLSTEDINEFFKDPLKNHTVLGVKGFLRRANLIPNRWKLRIGATHELFTDRVDYNVQIQGLTGRMTGYWRRDIEDGHKTGPHRTCIKAIEEYERTYLDPFGANSYQTAGFTKSNGRVNSRPTMLSAKNIENLEAIDLPDATDPKDPRSVPIVMCVEDVEYDSIKKIDNMWDAQSIMEIIQKYAKGTHDKIKNMDRDQIVQPLDKSYPKIITASVNAFNRSSPFTWGLRYNKPTRDIYQIYLDNVKKRIIVSIYYGSKNL